MAEADALMPMDLGTALRAAAAILAEAGVPTPRADAELLAAHLLGTTRGGVVSAAVRGGTTPPGFAEAIARRAGREPLQHITGVANFRSVRLAVGPGVFVPRPETEIVAGLAIAAAQRIVAERGRAVVADLGTGSGAIALAVATEVPAAQVVAVEADPVAADWAARNLADRPNVKLIRADAGSALSDAAFDVVVTNPPYVPPGTPAEPEVGYDPPAALWGHGSDGLDVPRLFAAAAARALVSGGVFVMEHAEIQAEAVREMLAVDFTDIATHNDLTGRPRATTARRRG